MSDPKRTRQIRGWLWLIRFVGLIVPARLRADWRQEWEAELRHREALLAQWDKLDRRNKLDLLRRSIGAFVDALSLQPRRLEDEMFQDLRFGARMLLKHKGFTLIAVITLALGIGANTAIFSVANGILLRPLPYQEPERLAFLRCDWRGAIGQAGIAGAEVVNLRQQSGLFDGVETLTLNNASLTGEQMEKLTGATVTEGFLPLLGVRPVLGSGLSQQRAAGERRIWDVVISHELWQRRFGSDPHIIGRKIEVNNATPVVTGVMPPGFRVHLEPGANVPEQIDLFFLGSLEEDGLHRNRQSHDLLALARLKPGVSYAQAQHALDRLTIELAQQYPNSYQGNQFKFHLRPLQQDVARQVRPALLALLGAVGLVLLIACANVANLVLVRTHTRAREWAIRAALGAGRFRLVRQLVTEHLLLALFGGLGGLLLAQWGVRLLLLLRPANLPRPDSIAIDGSVLLVTLLATLFTGVALGLIPAWQAWRVNVNERLKESGSTVSRSRNRLRHALVIAQVALSLVLLAGAGLMLRTFVKLNQLDWGFDPDRLLTVKVNLQPRAFPETERRWHLYQQAVEKVRALPGVTSVSAASPLPFTTDGSTTTYALYEATPTPAFAALHTVLPDYFATLRIALRAGRDFTAADIERQLPLAVVDEKFARQSWPGENPIGKKLLWQPGTKRQQWLEVIGVAAHVRTTGFRAEGPPQLYLPYQSYALFDMTLFVRGQTDLRALGPTIKREIEQLGTNRPVHSIRNMDDYVARQLSETRFALTLLGLLAALALTLCLVGLYSVVAYTVSQRTRELGIRLALGAQRSDVLRLVFKQGLTLVAAGLALGLLGALLLTRALSGLLFGVSANDPLTFVAVVLLLGVLTLAACYQPARRAAKVDPLIALRHE